MQFLTEPEPPRAVPLPVAPGITRVVAPNPGVMTYRGTNTYLIQSPEGVLLVDPGPDDPTHVQAVLAAAGSRVAAILLTHTHHDHVGALPALREATGAPVHAWHDPADPAVKPDIALRDGDRVGAWQALHTPGHAPDHLCFRGPAGILLSGDHVMSWSTTVIGAPGGNMADYFRSLERLLDLDAPTYLPGHGPPLAESRPFVRALLGHRQLREAAIAATLGPAPLSIRDIAAAVYPEIDSTLRRAAERNVAAHLDKLRSDGAARQAQGGWVTAP